MATSLRKAAALTLAVAATVLVAGVQGGSAAQAPADWVVASMVASGGVASPAPPGGGGSFLIGGPSGRSLTISASGHATGDGPVLLGFATRFGGGPAFVDVFDTANGGIKVRTTADLGGVDIEITAAESGAFSILSSVGGSAPWFAHALFVANGVFDSYSAQGSGGIPVMQAGSGTRAIMAAGTDIAGFAADASAVAIGSSSHEMSITKGLIGGIVLECSRCTVEWTGPNGKAGSVTQTWAPRLPVPVPLPAVVDGDPMFAGPAGQWSWSWTGVNLRTQPSPTVVAAYAPIGDLWQLFAGGEPTLPAKPAPSRPAEKPESRVLPSKQVGGRLASTGVGPQLGGWLLVAGAALVGRRLVRSA